MSPSTLKNYILVQGAIMTVGIVAAGFFMKDPPKNWWPKEIDPLNWKKNSTRDLMSNPPSLRHYTSARCGARRRRNGSASSTPSTSAAPCSAWPLLWVRHGDGLGYTTAVVGFAGFSLADGLSRPVYGYISEFIGRRRTMIYAYSGNVVFQLLAFFAGSNHNAPCSSSARSSPAACPAPTSR